MRPFIYTLTSLSSSLSHCKRLKIYVLEYVLLPLLLYRLTDFFLSSALKDPSVVCRINSNIADSGNAEVSIWRFKVMNSFFFYHFPYSHACLQFFLYIVPQDISSSRNVSIRTCQHLKTLKFRTYYPHFFHLYS